LLVHDNVMECSVSKEKINYHETIHYGARGTKETISDRAIGMKSRFVGHRFIKQAKNGVSD